MHADEKGALAAAEVLGGGGVIVVPTDTVYGLAARPTDADAVQAVFRAKGRPEGMQLPVLAASLEQVRALGVDVTPAALALARWWWPGPLTMAFGFEARSERPAWLAGRDEVAVRIPDHDFLRALLARTGVLVVTSANPHGAPTPRTALDVAASLGPSVDLVVDGGRLHDVPSTLVNVSGTEPVVEREGAISRAEVADALGEAP
ncbi:MAG: L-threonylcarbamoyladenylate synthase, partial [Acidimicrobiales bacterium]